MLGSLALQIVALLERSTRSAACRFGSATGCHGIPASLVRRRKYDDVEKQSSGIRSSMMPSTSSYFACPTGNNPVNAIMPDGYFYEDHIVFGDPGNGSVIARGYTVNFPDLSASDDQAFIDLEVRHPTDAREPEADERLQLQFYTSSDFSGPLNRFVEDTRANSKVEICSKVRDELAFRYRDRMACETLIQANVRLYLSSQIPKIGDRAGRKVRGFDEVFKVLRRSFDQRQQFFDLLLAQLRRQRSSLGQHGSLPRAAEVLVTRPGRVWHPKPEDIDWLRTVTDLCQFSELAPRREPEQGFYLDGYYFGVDGL